MPSITKFLNVETMNEKKTRIQKVIRRCFSGSSASILSACIQQRSNVSGALAKDVESMVYRIKGHSSSAVVYHTKARQEDSLTNLQLGTV